MSAFENKALDETRRVLDEARDALLGYAAANGYFPCPASNTSNGREGAGADHVTGDCPAGFHGFLPAATLGLTSVDASGYAVDGRRQPENRLRYAVSNQTVSSVANPFTAASGLRRVGLTSVDTENLFFVCANGAIVTPGTDCGAAPLTSRAVAVVWSVGGNAGTGGTGVHEGENPNPQGGTADRIFVSRGRSVVAGAEFDDTVVWIPIQLVVNRLLQSGLLP
jgi:hypothetical protein